MSLLEELESRGVTAEDLEKAASVRLFEKAAAAEGVDLDSLDVDQVEELYAAFLSNPSYNDNTPTKEASAMNDEIVDLFEKTAAAEGIDLDEMADAELAELYNHYVENVLPLQIEEYEKGASANEVDEATEKLAEAEILGRHMARAYMDELSEFDKEAASRRQVFTDLASKGKAQGLMGRLGRAATESRLGQAVGAGSRRSEAGHRAGAKASQGVMDKAIRKAQKAAKKKKGGKLTEQQAAEIRRNVIKKTDSSKAVAKGQRKGQQQFERRVGMGLTAAGGLGTAGAAGLGYKAMKKESSWDEGYTVEEVAEEIASDLLADALLEYDLI